MNDKCVALLLNGWVEVSKKGAQVVGKGNIPGVTRVPSKEELATYFRGCGSTFAGYDPGVHWCGMFATYLLRQAGVRCHWVMGKGIANDSAGGDLEIIQGAEAKTGLLPGDIVVREPHHHHIIALESVTSGWIRCIEGNAGGIKSPMVAMNWAGNMQGNNVANVTTRYRIRG